MGSIPAGKIIDAVSTDLFDTGTTRRYPEPKLLEFLSDGEKTIVALKPSENTLPSTFALVEGIYQLIPATMEKLIRPIRNMGVGGATPGGLIKTADYDHFSTVNPTWPSATPSATVELIMLDTDNEYGFFCYPPQPASPGSISVLGSVLPAAITDRATPITLRDGNEMHLYHYILHRCYKIMQSPVAKAESVKFWNLCVTGIGRKDMIDKGYSPNRDRKKEQRSNPDAN